MTLRYDLRINQGETFRLAIPVYDEAGSPVDLSGMTARGQIRTHSASPTVLHEWSSMIGGNLAYDWNEILLTVPDDVSTLWAFRTGQWDLELSDTSGFTTRLVEGMVIVHPEVTR